MALFVYGTLLHPPLFAALVGADPTDMGTGPLPALLPGHRVERVADGHYPLILSAAGAETQGHLWPDLAPRLRARLDAYELAFGYDLRTVEVLTAQGPVRAEAYFPPPSLIPSGEAWSIEAWHKAEGLAMILAAEEIAAHDPPLSAAGIARQWPMIGARAHAAARARGARGPAVMRRGAGPDDYAWSRLRPPAGGFFKHDTMVMEHDRFDGARARGLVREVLVGVDAALVLPYDAARDRVLMVEQFRTGPARRGDPNPWTLEPVAGIVDGGETPEEAARREAFEEAGIAAMELVPMFAVYPSPGSTSDYFHCFLGLCDLPDDHPAFGGLASEAEDLRLHVLARDAALGLIDTGEITAGPLVAMMCWLDRRVGPRGGLRSPA
ncbi:MAG: NUDIX domain-containing protein [Rubellimicrobium sp.]|nr:NUDIX domain-containing protein [Rubellimicrobium sp.]